MKRTIPALMIVAIACLATPFAANAGAVYKSKVAVESTVAKKTKHDAPCFIVYPEGEAYLTLIRSGVKMEIEEALSTKGYQIMAKADDAAIFIKIEYAALPTFEAKVKLKGRDQWDYTNAASTRNYATLIQGGRYSELANPDRNRETGTPNFIIGPSGEIIDTADQKSIEATIKEGEVQTKTLVIHPVAFRISGWRFDDDKPNADPQNIWQVTTSIENIVEEPIEPQLSDLADAAIAHIGKPLKKPKLVTRKSDEKDKDAK